MNEFYELDFDIQIALIALIMMIGLWAVWGGMALVSWIFQRKIDSLKRELDQLERRVKGD